MENKTPIQEWIEENEYPKVLCFKLLVYLGLQDVEDPKKWVEDAKLSIAKIEAFKAIEDCQEIHSKVRWNDRPSEIEQLQAENERLKECFDNVKKQLLITLEHFNEPKNEYQRGVKYEALRTLNGLNALKGETT